VGYPFPVSRADNSLSFPIEPLPPEQVVQLVIAEFDDRRTEINNRTTIQHLLVGLNITAAGAVGGVALAGESPNLAVLLLLSPICSALAMLWANHADTIARIGAFIRYRIRPLVEEERGPLWRWELDHDVFGESPRRRFLAFGLPVFLVFVGPPLVSLVLSFKELIVEGGWQSRMWYVAGAGMTAYGATLLILSMRGPRFTSDLTEFPTGPSS
jgi:hypothetical protein